MPLPLQGLDPLTGAYKCMHANFEIKERQAEWETVKEAEKAVKAAVATGEKNNKLKKI